MTQDATLKFGWQNLAQLDLLVTTDFESQVQIWMIEATDTLGIDSELSNRMLKSALGVISRTENSNDEEPYSPSVHLRFYIPLEIPTRSGLKRNWGFFRIDKHGGTSLEGDPNDHLIEFFLYLDGQTSITQPRTFGA